MISRYSKNIDLLWADSGDYCLEARVNPLDPTEYTGGDFEDTKDYNVRGWLQRVITRLKSNLGDWAYLDIGANLSAFQGSENTQETAEAIKSRILNELFSDNLCQPQELSVEVVPTSPTYLGIILIITPPGSGQTVTLVHGVGLRDSDHVVTRKA